MMSPLFNNAIVSIRMGIEDYKLKNDDRYISAVRNLYAGVLLLAKEALVRAAPQADPLLIISAKLKPVPDSNGDIEFGQVGHTTIDFVGLIERAKDFKVPLDGKRLKDLNTIRNNMEHLYSNHPEDDIRAAISKALVVAAELFLHLGENPAQHLGAEWQTMLLTTDVYDKELAAARASFKNIRWHIDISEEDITCPSCRSELVEQLCSDNDKPESIILNCKSCGEKNPGKVWIESFVDQIFHRPINYCPVCNAKAINEYLQKCANCGNHLQFTTSCLECHGDISVLDYLNGIENNVCSNCLEIKEKEEALFNGAVKDIF